MVIEGNSPGTFFLGVMMDVRMDGRMDVSRVVDRDRGLTDKIALNPVKPR